MDQTVSSGAVAPMGRSAIGSKDASALQDAKGSSVRKKVKQGNTVIRAEFSIRTRTQAYLEKRLAADFYKVPRATAARILSAPSTFKPLNKSMFY